MPPPRTEAIMIGHPKLDWALAAFANNKPLIRIDKDTRVESYEATEFIGIAGNGLFIFQFTAQ